MCPFGWFVRNVLHFLCPFGCGRFFVGFERGLGAMCFRVLGARLAFKALSSLFSGLTMQGLVARCFRVLQIKQL